MWITRHTNGTKMFFDSHYTLPCIYATLTILIHQHATLVATSVKTFRYLPTMIHLHCFFIKIQYFHQPGTSETVFYSSEPPITTLKRPTRPGRNTFWCVIYHSVKKKQVTKFIATRICVLKFSYEFLVQKSSFFFSKL